MKFRWILICLLLVALPSVLYARPIDWNSWGKNLVNIEEDTFGVVVFNHNDHFDYLGERICTTCHDDIFSVDQAKNPDFTMQDMEEGQSCGACHDGQQAFGVQESCASCHPTQEITYDVPATGPVTFSHDVHTMMFGCDSCHPETYVPGPGNPTVSMDAMNKGQSCGACHDGQQAFGVQESCASCHPTQEITYDVPATGPVTFSHDVHTMMFGCDSCHPETYAPGPGNPTVSMDAMNKGQSCGACHDGQQAFGVQESCASCHPTQEITYDVPATGPVTFSHDVHTMMFGCDSCHPETYAPGPGNPTVSMDAMNKGQSCGACHDGQQAFGVQESCASCHPTQEITYDVPATGPVTFSHDVHTMMFGCDSCHPETYVPGPGNPTVSMDAMNKGQSCGACHDGQQAFGVQESCASCHPTREITYDVPETGPVTFSHDVHTMMFGCDSCHPETYVPGPGNPTVSMDAMNKGQSCGACHDGQQAFGVQESCASCHPTREIAYDVPSIGPVTFSHDVHTMMFGCDSCHPDTFIPGPDNPTVSMDEMSEGKSCGACHYTGMAFSVEGDCGSCHQM